ncbi:MAG TPA: hypothetical protein DCW39_02795 [Betaproteobacteria bacterium]|nr:hypothetical protein [Betaproteobacteria bacterium]
MTSVALSSPVFFLLLAGLIGTVVLLYLLRPPVLNRLMSSNLIWRRILGSSRAINERWRWWLSLLLATLIAICLLLATFRPMDNGQMNDRSLIIFDNAPSMGALTQDGLSRFNVAKDSVIRHLNSLSKDMQVMLVDTQRQVTTPSFGSISQALEILDSLSVGNSLDPLVPAQVATIDASRKFIYTDGVMIGGVPEDFTSVSAFQPVPNVGITRLSFAAVPGNTQQRQAFIEIVNGGGEPTVVEIALTQTESRLITRQVELAPYEKLTQIFDATAFESGPVKASVVSTVDRFKADDVAFGYITAKRQVRVGFVSDDVDSKMLTLLDLMPRVVLTSLTNADYQGLESEELQFDILVFDRVSVDRKPVIPSIFFGVNSANWLGASVSSIRSSQLSVEKNTAHPILRNISMTDLLIESGVLFAPAVGVEALLTSEDEAILAIAVPGAVKSVLLGFDLDKSNLAFLADFPIFLSNSITWLVDEPPILNATPGTIKLPSDITKVYRIDGVDVPLWFADGNSYFHTRETGLFTGFSSNGPLRVSVSQLDRRFSDINKSNLPIFESSENFVAPGLNGYSLSFLVGALTLILLMVDWYLYHRRVTQ